MPGHDAVIVTASLSELKTTPDYFSRGTKLCIDAMQEFGVKRLVVLSAQDAGESRAAANWFLRTFVIGGILKRAFADHDVQEQMTRESELAWVIARPTRLTSGAAKGTYIRTADPAGHAPSSISRADVAEVESSRDSRHLGRGYHAQPRQHIRTVTVDPDLEIRVTSAATYQVDEPFGRGASSVLREARHDRQPADDRPEQLLRWPQLLAHRAVDHEFDDALLGRSRSHADRFRTLLDRGQQDRVRQLDHRSVVDHLGHGTSACAQGSTDD
jgi:hypothetical protein